MTSMIERGAEAMRAKRRELIAQPLDRIWPDLMRAALEAVREPSKSMVQETCSGYPSDVWRSMIDAALKPEGQP